MSRKVNAIKAAAVALGWASATTDMTSSTVSGVLKEIAVLLDAAKSVGEIRANSVAEVVQYIADNYGSEEHEPYNISASTSHVLLTVKRKGKTITVPSSDILYNGDVLTITATPGANYVLTTLTINGDPFESGKTYTVNGHNVAIVAMASAKRDLAVTAGENTSVTVTDHDTGTVINPGEDVIHDNQIIDVAAAAAEGYDLTTFTINGETPDSNPTTIAVESDIAVVTAATAQQDPETPAEENPQ